MVGLFLMTQKGHHVLEAIVRQQYLMQVAFVCSARDAALSKDYYDEIRELCQANQIPFFDRKEHIGISVTYGFAISWRWLIKIEAPLIVLHDSLLPRYRGFAPLVSALINGDSEVGVTALQASAEYDRGDIIMQKSIRVSYPKKIGALIDEISVVYAKITTAILEQIVTGETLAFVPQDEAEATYSLWRNDDDYRIDWNNSAEVIQRNVDALDKPYKGAQCIIDGRIARVAEAVVIEDVIIENRKPGKVIFVHGGKPVIVCGSGLLRIDELCWEDGSDALPLKNFRTQLK